MTTQSTHQLGDHLSVEDRGGHEHDGLASDLTLQLEFTRSSSPISRNSSPYKNCRAEIWTFRTCVDTLTHSYTESNKLDYSSLKFDVNATSMSHTDTLNLVSVVHSSGERYFTPEQNEEGH